MPEEQTPDEERVARYAEALWQVAVDGLYEPVSAPSDWSEEARAVVAVADEEIAALAAEVERLREHVAQHLRDYIPTSDTQGVNPLTGDLAVDMAAYAGRLRARAEAAEAEAERLRGRLEISERSLAEARGDDPSGDWSQRDWEDWSNDLAMLLPEDAETWPGVNPEGAQESIIENALRYLVAAEAALAEARAQRELSRQDAQEAWNEKNEQWVAALESADEQRRRAEAAEAALAVARAQVEAVRALADRLACSSASEWVTAREVVDALLRALSSAAADIPEPAFGPCADCGHALADHLEGLACYAGTTVTSEFACGCGEYTSEPASPDTASEGGE